MILNKYIIGSEQSLSSTWYDEENIVDIHQVVAPRPIERDPHEEQSLGMKWSPAEEENNHNGHQHFNHRPLPMCENPEG